ncbi:ATP-binding protein [Clostridium paraputrificum]|uniref:sensor histidine kinase n=1 Tax=Clostridium paraputrificum TaxID=29363 RepID=UPI003D342C98
MFKTLRSKMMIVCIILIMWIAGVGMTSIYSISMINKEIESLMVNNYKSIDTIYNMMNAIQKQNQLIRTYIDEYKEENITSFNKKKQEFMESYEIEKGNITEKEEYETVNEIGELYEEYNKQFITLHEMLNSTDILAVKNFYNREIMSSYNLIVDKLNYIKDINEIAMNDSRDETIDNATRAKYIIIVISLLAVVSGYLITSYLVNKLLKPLKILNSSIIEVREGNMGVQIPVSSKDELGELTIEFNRMNERLHQFERNTLGELVREKNKSLAIVKSIQEPIIVIDKNYKVILVNPKCESFFRIDERESVNKHFSEIIKEENIFEAICEINNKNIKDKILRVARNEEEYYFKLSVNDITDELARIYGYIVVLQDITKLKELEIMKEDFLATISHEFKTSLTSIMIGTSLLETKKLGDLSEKQRKVLETIKDDGGRLNKLISDLITLRKIESNKELYTFVEGNIEEIIKTSITTVKSLADYKDIILEYDIGCNIPNIICDKDKLVWVVNNLISNAIKNCNSGDVIAVRSFRREGRIFVSIADTGCGMPKELTKSIFNKYVQIKSGDSVPQGFGLGLSIAKEIIEGHKGEIWCDSDIGKGSIFTFVLPLGGEKNEKGISC